MVGSGVWNWPRVAEMGTTREIDPQLQFSHVAHTSGGQPVGSYHMTHGKEGKFIIEYRYSALETMQDIYFKLLFSLLHT